MPELTGYHYAPMPLDRKPAKRAPHAYQTTQQPASKNAGMGRSVSPGWTAGGDMNTGKKRRPGSRTVR